MKLVLAVMRRFDEILATIACAIVAGLLIGDVFAREIFATPVHGAQKMAVFAAVYTGFVGLSLATADNSHLRAKFSDKWWPPHLAGAVETLGDVLSAALFFGIGVVALINVSITYENMDRAEVLYWPLWPIQLVIPYAFFASGVRHLIFATNKSLKPTSELHAGAE